MATSAIVAKRLENGRWEGITVWLDGGPLVLGAALVARVRDSSAQRVIEEVVDGAPIGWEVINEDKAAKRSSPPDGPPFPLYAKTAERGLYAAMYVLDPHKNCMEFWWFGRWGQPVDFSLGPEAEPDWLRTGEVPHRPGHGLPRETHPAGSTPELLELAVLASELVDWPSGRFPLSPGFGARHFREVSVGDCVLEIPDEFHPITQGYAPEGLEALAGVDIPPLATWVEKAQALGLRQP